MLFLSEEDVQNLLPIEKVIELVEGAFKEVSEGTAVLPQRLALQDPAPGLTLIMPAILGKQKAIATKIVTVYKNNPKLHNLPVILAKIALQNYETGEVIGMIDGTTITKLRTGAATAISIKYLARKDSKTLGIYGAGVQAEGQLIAACSLKDFSFEKCRVYDTDETRAQQFKEKMEKICGIDIEVQEDTIDFVNPCDIVITSTTSPRPLFNGNDLSKGTHVSSIGAHAPDVRELDTFTMIRASKIAADFRDACLKEAGDFIIPINEGILKPEKIVSIGDIIMKKVQGRVSDDEITVFKSVGIAVQDVACANYVYHEAIKEGIGKEI